jgi:hypothetical protein
MSISDLDVKAKFNGNGATVAFAIPFAHVSNDSAETFVYLVDESVDPVTETLQVEGALQDYTLTGASPPGTPFDTHVTFNTAPSASYKVLIIRSMALTQPADLNASQSVDLTAIETGLDRVVAQVQELDEKIQRAPKFRKSNTVDTNPLLPDPGAGLFLKWNTAETGLENASPVLNAAAGSLGLPVTSTDNAVVKWDGTSADTVQNSGVVIDDSNNVTGVVALTASGTVTLSGLTTPSTVLVAGASKEVASSAVSSTELGYVSGVTSAIQTQMNLKAPLASPTFTGTITTPLTASRVVITDLSGALEASTITAVELSYLDDVTSNIQDQLDVLAGGSGANTALSNVASVQASANITPGTSDSIDLGDSTDYWRRLYLMRAIYRSGGAEWLDAFNGRLNNNSGNCSIYLDSHLLRTGTHGAPVTKLDWSGTTDIIVGNTAGVIKFLDSSKAAASIGYVWTLSNTTTGQGGWAVGTATASSINTSDELTNVGIATSVAASALTISLKTKAGTDPAGGDIVYVGFRNATITTGTYTQVSISSALSVVVSSGSTLGMTSALEGVLYVYLINNAGTAEMAVSQVLYDEGSVVSTTAEGGAGAADSASAIYSTTARSNVPVRLIGRIRITEATAGTWASNATEVSLVPFDTQKIIAIYSCSTGDTSTTTNTWNYDTLIMDTHSAVTTNATAWKFTAPRTALYRVTCGLSSATASVGLNNMYVYKGGVLSIGLVENIPQNQAIQATGYVYLRSGEYIDIRNGSASTTTLNANAAINRISIESV